MIKLNRINLCLALTIALLAASAPSSRARGASLFVAVDAPNADDKNAGTEAAPFKTIQAAVNLAKPGDTIYLKAGLYQQYIELRTRGTRRDPITICPYKDDHVRIGSAVLPVPAKENWKKVEVLRAWETTLPEGTPDDVGLLIDGKMPVPELGPQPLIFTDKPPQDEMINIGGDLFPACTYDRKTRKLMVNAGGKNPLDTYTLTLIRRFDGNFRINSDAGNWIIRGLEICDTWNGMVNFGDNIVVEDCYFRHNVFRGVFGSGFTSILRRCTFDEANLDGCAGIASVFEDNIFSRSGNCFKGTGYGMTFRYNFYDACGWWGDGSGTGTRLYGNAFHDSGGYAIYNEYAIDDTLIIGNYMGNTQAGVASSYCSRMSVLDNYISGPGSGVILHNRGMYPMKHSFMTVRGNAIVGSSLGLSGYGASYDFGPQGWDQCLVDYNKYRIKGDQGMLLDLDGKIRCAKLEEMQKKQGWEIHGEAKPFDEKNNDLTPESLGGGTVTVRLPVGENGWKAREMLSDPGLNNKFPAAAHFEASSLPAFFWRVADGNYSEEPFKGGYPELRNFEHAWQASCYAGYDEGEVYGAAWGIYADQPTKGPKMTEEECKVTSDGNRYLGVKGKTPEKMLAQGVGFWTPCLPTAPEAKINVSMKIRGAVDLAPLGDNGGVSVWVRFTNLTGQQVSRVFLVGRDDEGKDHNAKFTKGTFDWTDLKETVTAPKTAGRMALFVGMRPGKGFVHFDDINVKTESGSVPAIAKKQECLPSRLPFERFRDIVYVDISKFANRGFADDEANNGKGGWSDQGPTADMREVKTGKRTFGKVPFDIKPDPGLITLKSSWRNPGTLPEKVVIPIGRKLDTLFFLHGAAYFGGGYFKYVIHYEDGKDVTLMVTPKNMIDWSAFPAKQRFPMEEGTFSTAAETVPSPMFGHGSFYRMEWTSPADRRAVAIKSIEFASDGSCVPVLIAITGIMEW
jgi:hypothetical protein